MSLADDRDAREVQQTTLWIIAIVALGTVLRFWTLGAGIPYSVGVDEPQVLNRAVTMMRSGDYNPHLFDYPGLYLYVQLLVACARFLVGALSGMFNTLGDASTDHFFLWGRAVTATLGSLTVLLVYFIGLRWGTRHALLAAGLMAVMPLHVRESHFVLTDVPVTFFVTLAFLMSLRASERATRTAFAWAGVAAGLAAATKYPGALALLLPLQALWMTPDVKPSRMTVAATTIAVAALAFLVCSPYTLLDLPGFLNGYARLMGSYTSATLPEPGWKTYLKHLLLDVGWAAFIAMAGGCGLAVTRIVRGPARMRWLLAVVFPLLYLWILSGQTLVFARYMLPMVPFVCVLGAAAVVSTAGTLRRFAIPRTARTAAVVLLTAATTLPPAVSSVSFNVRQSKRGTAALAYDWIRTNIPAGTRITLEGTDVVLMFAPYESRNLAQLRMRRYEDYVAGGVRYLVASSQCYGPYLGAPQRFSEEHAEYMALFARGTEVARFTPSSDHPGPELRIIKVGP